MQHKHLVSTNFEQNPVHPPAARLEVHMSDFTIDEIILRRQLTTEWYILKRFDDCHESSIPGPRTFSRTTRNPSVDLMDVAVRFGKNAETISHESLGI